MIVIEGGGVVGGVIKLPYFFDVLVLGMAPVW